MVLLDTDILIDLLRKYPPAVTWLASLGIGGTAVALNLSLHTFNQKHYAPIPNLKTAQPYSKGVQTQETI